jgi:hypothetical protein
MKHIFLFHDNALPHTHLRTREAIAKLRWTVLPHSAQSPDLAPSSYHLFGAVKNALRGRHFADDNELKVFVVRSEVEAGDFATLVYSVLLKFGKSVLKRTETL